MPHRKTALFDLDGTLVDSDGALLAPFHALGVDPGRIPPLGLPASEACTYAGISLEDYVRRYDGSLVVAFPGVDDLLEQLDRWAVCSNKLRAAGVAELARLGWQPEVALFSEDFDGRPKRLEPLLERLALSPADAIFVGDTAHDRTMASSAGVPFALAGWNDRAVAQPGDIVLRDPIEVLDLLR